MFFNKYSTRTDPNKPLFVRFEQYKSLFTNCNFIDDYFSDRDVLESFIYSQKLADDDNSDEKG